MTPASYVVSKRGFLTEKYISSDHHMHGPERMHMQIHNVRLTLA